MSSKLKIQEKSSPKPYIPNQRRKSRVEPLIGDHFDGRVKVDKDNSGCDPLLRELLKKHPEKAPPG